MSTASESVPTRRRPGRPPKAEAGDTKDALLQAAVRLFARYGYAGTSIRAIAREVGLSESVLYAHFESKEAVFDAVLTRYGPQGSASTVTDVDPGLAETDPPRFLTELVDALLEDWDSEESRLLISLMTRDGLMHTAALREAVTGMRRYAADLFAGWIARGQIPGHHGSAEQLAFSFTGPIGLARVLHLHADASPEERTGAREAVQQHVDLYARSIFHGKAQRLSRPTDPRP